VEAPAHRCCGEKSSGPIAQEVGHPHGSHALLRRVPVQERITAVLHGVPSHRKPFIPVVPGLEKRATDRFGTDFAHQLPGGIEEVLFARTLGEAKGGGCNALRVPLENRVAPETRKHVQRFAVGWRSAAHERCGVLSVLLAGAVDALSQGKLGTRHCGSQYPEPLAPLFLVIELQGAQFPVLRLCPLGAAEASFLEFFPLSFQSPSGLVHRLFCGFSLLLGALGNVAAAEGIGDPLRQFLFVASLETLENGSPAGALLPPQLCSTLARGVDTHQSSQSCQKPQGVSTVQAGEFK